MSQLTNILLAPFRFFVGENGIFSSLTPQPGNEAGQMLYKGIPALVFAIFGLLFLIVGELSAGKSLIERYEGDVAVISDEESKLKKELSQELHMARAKSQNFKADTTEIVKLRDRLSELLESKKILLSKLHSLAPEQGKYQFQLASNFFTKSELALIMPANNESEVRTRQELSKSLKNQGVSIMKQLAPIDKPGYLDAHLYLASGAAFTGGLSNLERMRKFRIVNRHLDHALVRDENNRSALSLKVAISEQVGHLDKTKVHLKKLFETDPYVYPQLCDLNSKLGVAEENLTVLHRAKEQLSGQLVKLTGSSDVRIKCATYLVDCMHRLENNDGADKVIRDEIRKFPDVPKVQLWGKRLTAISREIRYRAKGPINAENAEVMLNFLREGYQQDPTNQRILGHLTQLRSSEIPGIAELAANIYQPNEKAPASVENILGTQALAKGNYLEAAKHMTRATQKDEKNGDYLNNLAYLYLVRPNPDPQEALKLIDRAIINVQASKRNFERLTHFYDTKGKALLALGKLAEKNGQKAVATSQYATATAQLLKAMIQRPDDLGIARSIAECYEANGQTEMAVVWADRVKQLQAAEEEKEAEDN